MSPEIAMSTDGSKGQSAIKSASQHHVRTVDSGMSEDAKKQKYALEWKGTSDRRIKCRKYIESIKQHDADSAQACLQELDALEKAGESGHHQDAFERFTNLNVQVTKLFLASLAPKSQAPQEGQSREAERVVPQPKDDEGAKDPTLGKKEYEALEAVQKPRIQEAERRCGPVPDLADALKPVSAGWVEVTTLAEAGKFPQATELLGGLVSKIAGALEQADGLEAREAEVKQKLTELKLRADQAPMPASTPDTDNLWKAATGRVAEVKAHLSNRQVGKASEVLDLLGIALTAAESKQKEFEAAKLEVVNKRKNLPKYAQALLIAAAPPPDDMLSAPVDAFHEKEKVVTDAEAANQLTEAENGHGALGVAAATLVDNHADWRSYNNTYTQQIRAVVEAANNIGSDNLDLQTQLDEYAKTWNLWSDAVSKAMDDASWPDATSAAVDLAAAATAMNDVHAQWLPYSNAFTQEIQANVGAADVIVKARPSDLLMQIDDYTGAHGDWSQAVATAKTDKSWDKAAATVSELGVTASALKAVYAQWLTYSNAFTQEIQANVRAAEAIKPAPEELKIQLDQYDVASQQWNGAVNTAKVDGSWAAAANTIAELATAAENLNNAHSAWVIYDGAFKQIENDYNDAIQVLDRITTTKGASAALPAEADRFNNAMRDWSSAKDDAEDDGSWAVVASKVGELGASAIALKQQNASAKQGFETAFSGGTKADIELAVKTRAENKPALAAQAASFAAVYDPWKKRVDGQQWTDATDGVKAVFDAADILLDAALKHKQDDQDFESKNLELEMVQKLAEATTYCEGKPMPVVDDWPAEVREFRRANNVLTAARNKADWTTAKAAVGPLQAAIDKVVPAFARWKEYGNQAQALAPLMERARLAAASAPASLAEPKQQFEAEAIKIAQAVTGNKWADALNALNAAKPFAEKLLEAQTQYNTQRQPFDTAAAAARVEYAKAAAVIRALPPNALKDQKVVDVNAAYAKLKEEETNERWADGINTAGTLKSKSEELLAAAPDLYESAATAEDNQVVPNKLKGLEKRMEKAQDTPALSNVIDKLQKAVVEQQTVVEARVSENKYLDAGVEYEKLVAALEMMEAAKKAHTELQEKFLAASIGPVDEAKAAKEPKALVDLRNAALDKQRARIEKAATKGQLSLASGMVDTWVADANGWKTRWEEATKAHAAFLSPPPPNEDDLKGLANAEGGGKVFDDLVASLPRDKTNADVFAKAIQVRFGVDMVQYEKRETEVHALKAVAGSTADKSVQQVYKLLATVPESHVKGTMDKITRYTKESDGGEFGPLMKQIALYCGRHGSRKKGDKPAAYSLLTAEELKGVDEDCRPVEGKQPKGFSFTALHEVGHAIDDSVRFMMARRGDAKFGGWLPSTADEAAGAAAEKFKYDKAYLAKVLANAGKPLPDDRPDKPENETAERKTARENAEEWCTFVVESGRLWDKPGNLTKAEVGGRVYQEAYAGDWVSYPMSARAQRITNYQFRSQFEWFAELYAAYYSKTLKETHPAVSWLKEIQRPNG
jgi:hypothetical protein